MKFFTLATALLVSVSAAFGQLKNADGDANISAVQAAGATLNSLQSTFKQTKKIAFVDGLTVSDGDFYYKKATGSLAMRYKNGELMIIDGDDVVLGKKGKVRTVKSTNKQVASLALTLLSCMEGDVVALDGTLKKSTKNSKVITFVVSVDFKVGKGKISELELTYGAKDGVFQSLKMTEGDGSYTLYELVGKKPNGTIDAKVFQK